jgi:hypothetical protein
LVKIPSLRISHGLTISTTLNLNQTNLFFSISMKLHMQHLGIPKNPQILCRKNGQKTDTLLRWGNVPINTPLITFIYNDADYYVGKVL